MNKILHGPNVAGQSLADRVMAAKHTIAGQDLAKAVFKATTDEVMGPKRKHLDYLIWCTNEPHVSIPDMAKYLVERTHSSSWVVVFKALLTTHDVINYGNERFTQYLASNHCVFSLTSFNDKTDNLSYDMSVFVRQYAKYLNEKASTYRQMGYDFCKVKRGKHDGFFRTMDTDKLLHALPVVQEQIDVLLEFGVSPNELTNGVINVAFMAMFKDLIRLFACYNDGIINLLEKYFDMDRRHCSEALSIYKKFVLRMEGVRAFLHVAEMMGVDKKDIPNLTEAPDGLCEALEEHLKTLDNRRKSGAPASDVPKAPTGISSVISKFTAASQLGTAPGAGSEVFRISDEERQKILLEEQKQLDVLKRQRQSKAAPVSVSSPVSPIYAQPMKISSASSPTSPVVQQSANRMSVEVTRTPSSVSDGAVRSRRLTSSLSVGERAPDLAHSNWTRVEEDESPPAVVDKSAKPPPGFTNFGDILQPIKSPTALENEKKSSVSQTASLVRSLSLNSAWGSPAGGSAPAQPTFMVPVSPTGFAVPALQLYSPQPVMSSTGIYPMPVNQYWRQPGMVVMPAAAAPGWPASPTPAAFVRPVAFSQPKPNDPFGAL